MESRTEVPFSYWAQQAPRSYVPRLLCFPLNDSPGVHAAVIDRLGGALARLADQRPDFTDTLETVQGEVPDAERTVRWRSPSGRICFRTHDIRDSYPYTYQQLRTEGFPPSAFVGDRFVLNVSPTGVDPVVIVQAFFISGGLFLGVYTSQQFADAESTDMFLELLAAQTSRRPASAASYPSDIDLFIPETVLPTKRRFKYLIRRAEPWRAVRRNSFSPLPMKEEGDWDDDLGPDDWDGDLGPDDAGSDEYFRDDVDCNPDEDNYKDNDERPTTGRIFVFAKKTLEEVAMEAEDEAKKSENDDFPFVSPPIDAFTIVSALAISHIIYARACDPSTPLHQLSRDSTVAENYVRTSISFRHRVSLFHNDVQQYTENTAANHFGNLSVCSVHDIRAMRSIGIICNPTADGQTFPTLADSMSELMNTAVYTVRKIVLQVDDYYMAGRLELARRMQEKNGLLQVEEDPRKHPKNWPGNLAADSWRNYGADIEWCIPGTGEDNGNDDTMVKPEVIRRPGGWKGDQGTVLVMPAREESDKLEVLVVLEEEAMERLLADKTWMGWVERLLE